MAESEEIDGRTECPGCVTRFVIYSDGEVGRLTQPQKNIADPFGLGTGILIPISIGVVGPQQVERASVGSLDASVIDNAEVHENAAVLLLHVAENVLKIRVVGELIVGMNTTQVLDFIQLLLKKDVDDVRVLVHYLGQMGIYFLSID